MMEKQVIVLHPCHFKEPHAGYPYPVGKQKKLGNLK